LTRKSKIRRELAAFCLKQISQKQVDQQVRAVPLSLTHHHAQNRALNPTQLILLGQKNWASRHFRVPALYFALVEAALGQQPVGRIINLVSNLLRFIVQI